MGASPATGGGDAACRVHGMTNLHIAGSAVFPASSQGNPTPTVVALAVRLAETLKRRFAAVPDLAPTRAAATGRS